MNLNVLDDVISRIPLFKWMARHVQAIFLLLGGFFLCVCFANLLYYIGGVGRDDIYQTRQVENVPIVARVPQMMHQEDKVYTLLLSSAAITTTTVVTISAATGVVLLPEQTLVFTFTPGLYQSKPISYTNDFTDPGPARISLLTNTGLLANILLPEELLFCAFARRFFIESLGGIVFTLLLPTGLLLIAGLFSLYYQEHTKRIDKVLQDIDELLKRDHDEDSSELNALLAELEKNRDLSDEQRKRYHNARCEAGIRDIRGFIRKGKFDDAKHTAQTLLQMNGLRDDQKKLVENLIAEDSKIHWECIASNSVNWVEHVAWLSFNGLLNRLSRVELDVLHKKIEGVRESIGIDLRRIESEIKLLKREFVLFDKEDESRKEAARRDVNYLIAQDIEGFFARDAKYPVIIVSGSSRSDRAKILNFFPGYGDTFYISISVSSCKNMEEVIVAIERACVTKLLDLLIEDIRLWTDIGVEGQRRLGDIFQKCPEIFDTDAIHRLKMKNMEQQLDNDLDQARNTLIAELQRGFQMVAEHDHRVERRLIGDIGDVLMQCKCQQMYIVLDELPSACNPVQLHHFLNGYLDQRVWLRVAYKESPAHFNPSATYISIEWNKQKLQGFFENLVGHAHHFLPESLDKLLAQVTEPDDFGPWLQAFSERYPDRDVTPERWQEVYTAMHSARNKVRPGARDWCMEDWAAAKQELAGKDVV